MGEIELYAKSDLEHGPHSLRDIVLQVFQGIAT